MTATETTTTTTPRASFSPTMRYSTVGRASLESLFTALTFAPVARKVTFVGTVDTSPGSYSYFVKRYGNHALGRFLARRDAAAVAAGK